MAAAAAAAARQVPLGREAHGVYSLCFGAGGAQLAAGFGDGAVQVPRAGRRAAASRGRAAARTHAALPAAGGRRDGRAGPLPAAGTGPAPAPGRHRARLPPRQARAAAGRRSRRGRRPLRPARGERRGLSDRGGERDPRAGLLPRRQLLRHGRQGPAHPPLRQPHPPGEPSPAPPRPPAPPRAPSSRASSLPRQLAQVVRAPDFMAGDEFTPFSGHSRRIFALRFHPTELHLFLTGGWDNSVKASAGPPRRPPPGPAPPRPAAARARPRLAACSLCQVWDKRVPKGAQSVINGPHICGPGIDVQGERVLTASWVPRDALQLWDLRMSRLWQNVPFPGNPTQGEFLYSAQFCTEDVVVAGGSGTSGAGIIHAGTGRSYKNKADHKSDIQSKQLHVCHSPGQR
ncbi:uncharacterized protein PHA67_022569 isoform 3-T3 [Liasis olivaceus]